MLNCQVLTGRLLQIKKNIFLLENKLKKPENLSFKLKVILKKMVLRYLKVGASTNQIAQWKFKGLSDKAIKIPPNSSKFFER